MASMADGREGGALRAALLVLALALLAQEAVAIRKPKASACCAGAWLRGGCAQGGAKAAGRYDGIKLRITAADKFGA